MKRFIIIPILFISILFSETTNSQIVLPDVTSPTVEKINILIPPLQSLGSKDKNATKFIEVLRNDLKNAALFNLVPGTTSAIRGENVDYQALFEEGIDYVVAGQYKVTGTNLKIALRVFDVRQERPLGDRTYDASPGKIREAAHRFSNIVMKQLTGIDGFFTSRVVVVVGGRKRDLFIMDYDGFNSGQLSAHDALVMSPNCSRDGKKLVYNSDKVWDQDLYVMNLTPRVRDTKISSTFSLEQSAEWSPDGSRLAFSSNGDIYTSNASGKNLKRLTKGYSIDVSPTWSPDGRRIAFTSDRSGGPQIYVMNAGGGNIRKITSGGYNTDPSWSPNPKVNKIAYVNVTGSVANIFSVNPDGSGIKQLTSGTRRNETPSWTPDGHFISFSSNRNVNSDIYLMYFNGENQVRLTKGGAKRFPTWCKG